MTRVDFHSNLNDRILYACRLARKVLASGMRMVIQGDPEILKQLDTKLWTFSALDFLPHCYQDNPLALTTPIILTTDAEKAPHYEILLNLTSAVPNYFARFERVLELVSNAPDDVQAGRERYKFYKARGYALQHFDQAGKA